MPHMFEGLSKREIFGWVICLALALSFTVFGGAYLIRSFLSTDVSDTPTQLEKPARNVN
jgi:hypothetical protein